jgi:hypothetical protein
MSTLKTNAIIDTAGGNTTTINGGLPLNATSLRTELNATGSAPMYACRAWVNFNGVTTTTIRAHGNASSVVRNAAGDYTINFDVPMPDANYVVVCKAARADTNYDFDANLPAFNTGVYTASSVQIQVGYNSVAGVLDSPRVTVAVFR